MLPHCKEHENGGTVCGTAAPHGHRGGGNLVPDKDVRKSPQSWISDAFSFACVSAMYACPYRFGSQPKVDSLCGSGRLGVGVLCGCLCSCSHLCSEVINLNPVQQLHCVCL